MKRRVPYILLLLVIADIYFFQAVETLTANSYIHYAYWLFDFLLVCTIVFAFVSKLPNKYAPGLTSWLMALTLLSLVPKVIALPVLLLEDITRPFRHFPPRTYW